MVPSRSVSGPCLASAYQGDSYDEDGIGGWRERDRRRAEAAQAYRDAAAHEPDEAGRALLLELALSPGSSPERVGVNTPPA